MGSMMSSTKEKQDEDMDETAETLSLMRVTAEREKENNTPFGISHQQLERMYKLPRKDSLQAVVQLMTEYYITLPCPERLLPLQAENVWKMDITVPANASPDGPLLTVAVSFTLWNEAQGCAFGTQESPILAFTSKFPLFFEGNAIDLALTMSSIGTMAIPEAFGRGFYNYFLPGKDMDVSLQKLLAELSSIPHFKPFKVLVHDATFSEFLNIMLRSAVRPVGNENIPFADTTIASAFPTAAEVVDDDDGKIMYYLCVCGGCCEMGLYNAKAGKIRSLRKCLGCHKLFYCGLICQKKHWPVHKLECKGKSRAYTS